MCVKTEWRTTDNPRWLVWLLLSTVVAGVLFVLEVGLKHESLWTSLAFPVAAALNIVAAYRGRLRLTDAGVEVRRLRTRLYRWSDIASVERAPEWDGDSVIWLQLRGSVPTAAPEILAPPGTRSRTARNQTLDDVVTIIQQRAELERAA